MIPFRLRDPEWYFDSRLHHTALGDGPGDPSHAETRPRGALSEHLAHGQRRPARWHARPVSVGERRGPG